jgi:hypothetical protein
MWQANNACVRWAPLSDRRAEHTRHCQRDTGAPLSPTARPQLGAMQRQHATRTQRKHALAHSPAALPPRLCTSLLPGQQRPAGGACRPAVRPSTGRLPPSCCLACLLHGHTARQHARDASTPPRCCRGCAAAAARCCCAAACTSPAPGLAAGCRAPLAQALLQVVGKLARLRLAAAGPGARRVRACGACRHEPVWARASGRGAVDGPAWRPARGRLQHCQSCCDARLSRVLLAAAPPVKELPCLEDCACRCVADTHNSCRRPHGAPRGCTHHSAWGVQLPAQAPASRPTRPALHTPRPHLHTTMSVAVPGCTCPNMSVGPRTPGSGASGCGRGGSGSAAHASPCCRCPCCPCCPCCCCCCGCWSVGLASTSMPAAACACCAPAAAPSPP